MSVELLQAAGLVLGTVQWGLRYGVANRLGQPSLAEVARIIACARAAGVHALDTARAYGQSEDIIGKLVGADAYWTVWTKLDPSASSNATALASLEASRTALSRPVLDGSASASRRPAHGSRRLGLGCSPPRTRHRPPWQARGIGRLSRGGTGKPSKTRTSIACRWLATCWISDCFGKVSLKSATTRSVRFRA